MKIAIVTLFPEMLSAVTEYGVTGRAVNEGLVKVTCFNPRDFTRDRHRTVDDRPYGGGPGMVMTAEPLRAALNAARDWAGLARVVYLSPQGQRLKHATIMQFVGASAEQALILIAGRYEGVDERFIELEVDEEWSIGDYVLSGGELPAMVLMDAVIRQLPGVLGHEQSAQQDSFADVLLDCPHYTRPPEFGGLKVPEVLVSGDHQAIQQWRHQQALKRTAERRPDLLVERDQSGRENKDSNE